MKKTLLLLLLITSALSGQNSTIAEIDRTIAGMKADEETYQKKEVLNTAEHKKIFYFKDNALAIVWIQETSNIEKNSSRYFVKDKLIYSETSWLRLSDGQPVFSEKIYCHNGKLIAWLNAENSFVDSNSPEFIKLDESLADDALQLLKESKE
jgi:hypothetical protein